MAKLACRWESEEWSTEESKCYLTHYKMWSCHITSCRALKCNQVTNVSVMLRIGSWWTNTLTTLQPWRYPVRASDDGMILDWEWELPTLRYISSLPVSWHANQTYHSITLLVIYKSKYRDSQLKLIFGFYSANVVMISLVHLDRKYKLN